MKPSSESTGQAYREGGGEGAPPLTSGDAVSGVLRALTPSRHPAPVHRGTRIVRNDTAAPCRRGIVPPRTPIEAGRIRTARGALIWLHRCSMGNPAPARPQTRHLVSRGTASSRPTTSHMPVQQAPPPRRTYPQSWTNLWKTSLVAAVNPQSCAHRWTSHEAHGDQDVDTPRGPKTRRGEGPEAGAGVPLLTEPDLI